MKIWAIADLHLYFSLPQKTMDKFGEPWIGHTDAIEKDWRERVASNDLVLIPGDISWAMRPEEVKADLDWIESLPGEKIMIKGNHDYWWASAGKVRKILPPSIRIVQNNSISWNGVSIAGTRLWDIPNASFAEIINFKGDGAISAANAGYSEQDEKIFQRELHRLELALKTMDKQAKTRLVMTHYPPIGWDLKENAVSELLERYEVNYCLFGHLHSVKKGLELFGTKNGISYLFTACDYLNNQLLELPISLS